MGTVKCSAGFTLNADREGCTANAVIEQRESELERQARDDAERVRIQQERDAAAKQKHDDDAAARIKAVDAARVAAELKARELEVERQQTEALETERRRRTAAWELDRQEAADERGTALVVSGVGIAGVGIAAGLMALGARQNDGIAAGGLESADDISAAAFGGQATNLIAWPAGVLGVVAVAMVRDEPRAAAARHQRSRRGEAVTTTTTTTSARLLLRPNASCGVCE